MMNNVQWMAKIWTFEVAHQGYLPLGVDRPLLKAGSPVRPGDRNFQHCKEPDRVNGPTKLPKNILSWAGTLRG